MRSLQALTSIHVFSSQTSTSSENHVLQMVVLHMAHPFSARPNDQNPQLLAFYREIKCSCHEQKTQEPSNNKKLPWSIQFPFENSGFLTRLLWESQTNVHHSKKRKCEAVALRGLHQPTISHSLPYTKLVVAVDEKNMQHRKCCIILWHYNIYSGL